MNPPADLRELVERTSNYVLGRVLDLTPIGMNLFVTEPGKGRPGTTWAGGDRMGGPEQPPDAVGVGLRAMRPWDGLMTPVWNTVTCQRMDAFLRGESIGKPVFAQRVAVQLRNYLRARVAAIGPSDRTTFYESGPGWPDGAFFGFPGDPRVAARNVVTELAADVLLPKFVANLELEGADPQIGPASRHVLPNGIIGGPGGAPELSGSASPSAKGFAYTVIATLAGADRLLPPWSLDRNFGLDQRMELECQAIVLDGSGFHALHNALQRAGLQNFAFVRDVLETVQRLEVGDRTGAPATPAQAHGLAVRAFEGLRHQTGTIFVVPPLPRQLGGTQGQII